MRIDECEHSFKELAKNILPQYMEKMCEALQTPHQMAMFDQEGVGVKTLLGKLKLDNDFKGCYVLVDISAPKPKYIYVGISRKVIHRLTQHVKGNTHHNATLAYRMAARECPHNMSRADAMKNPKFLQCFHKAKERIRGFSVAFIEISNDLELHLFEVYCSMELGTCQWNTFRTH